MVTTGPSRIDLSGDIITLVVGPECAPLKVHDSAIRQRSDFFKAALGKAWFDSRERSLKLPEDKLEIVTLYVQHLYTGKIFVTHSTDRSPTAADQNLPQYFMLAELYLFGEKIGDPRFKNAVLDAFVARMHMKLVEGGQWYPVTAVVDVIYKGTMPGSLARKLMVDAHTWDGQSSWIPQDPESSNKEFLVDLSRAVLNKRPSPIRPSPLKHAIAMGNYHEVIKEKTRV